MCTTADGIWEPQERSSCTSMSHKDLTTDIAVLFVHGLDGSPFATFTSSAILSKDEERSRPEFWECFFGCTPHPPLKFLTWFEWIEEDAAIALPFGRAFAQLDLYTLDYRTDFEEDKRTVVGIAKLIRESASFRSFLEGYNHVYIVAHSLGGLIMKQLLVDLRFYKLNASRSRIVGIGLLGVPSRGSPLADAAEEMGAIVELFQPWAGKNWKFIDDLRTVQNAGSFLVDLESKWSKIVDAPDLGEYPVYVACGYETKHEGGMLKVVPRFYSETACSTALYPIDKSHINLPKPEQQDQNIDEAHRWLIDSLRKALRRLEEQSVREWKYPRTPFSVLVEHIGRVAKHHETIGDRRQGKEGWQEGLPYSTAEVRISDLDSERVKRFFPWIPEGGYAAPTYWALLKKIGESKENGCLHVDVDQRRRIVNVRLEEPVECGESQNGLHDLACRPVDCPAAPMRTDIED